MNLEKIYKFRVSSVYPARQVYTDILYPDKRKNYYEKTMPVAQALHVSDTCFVEVYSEFNTKWYPITRARAIEILDAIDAGKVPIYAADTLPIPVTISNYIKAIEATVDYADAVAGKYCDLKIEKEIKISGTIYKAYNSDEGKIGYYLLFHTADRITNDITSPKVIITNGFKYRKEIALVNNTDYLVFLGDDDSVINKYYIQFTGTVNGVTENVYTDLLKVKFAPGFSHYRKAEEVEEPEPEEPTEPEEP